MTSETSPLAAPPPPQPRAAPAARGWTGSDLAVGSALIVLLISLFLPWFTQTARLDSVTALSRTGSGLQAHGYLWVVFVITLIGLMVLVGRDALAQVPGNLPTAEQLLVLATGLAVLLTVLGLVFRPSGYVMTGSALLPVIRHVTVSFGWSYGGFVAVVAAAVAFVAALGSARPLRTAHRVARPAWQPPFTGG